MSILDAVRNKYKTAVGETDKTDKTSFVSNVSPTDKHFQIFLVDLERLAGDDWPEIVGDPAKLAALKTAAETATAIRRGEVPSHYTATTECTHCGPVPIFPGLAAKVDGCPWCLARVRGVTVPRVK